MNTKPCSTRLRFRAPLSAGVVLLLPSLLWAQTVDFNRDVRPILADNCFACHGPDAAHRAADLRLDVEQDAKAAAIVEGRPGESELVVRINSEDPDVQMPPADSGSELTAAEIALIHRWIEQGAEYAPYWAYVPPRRHPVPAAENEEWCLNWIDSFILRRLQQERLRPSPEADRITLMRRLSFDLTGSLASSWPATCCPAPVSIRRSHPATTACCRHLTKAEYNPRNTWPFTRRIACVICPPSGWQPPWAAPSATIRGGITYGATDELGYDAVDNVVHIRDLHATMLHLLGIDHRRFTVKFQGLDMRLAGVEEARVVQGILA